jgi:competence protein ComEC
MAILGMLATFTARPYVVIRALALAALGMVLWNPFVLVYDPGFQLSFMATVGLILGAPLVERFITKVPTLLDFRGILAATVATQVAVLPLLLYQIGQVSLVAPIVNMLVLPLVAYMMLLGFLAGLVGMVSTTLAFPLAWLAHILLGYTFVVVDLFGRFSFASILVPPVSVWVVGVLYAVLALVYVRVRDVGGDTRHVASGE